MEPLTAVPNQNEQYTDSGAVWSPILRVAFRFAFVFFLLFEDLFPYRYDSGVLDPVWRRLVPWVGRHALHLEIPTTFGLGDTVYGYAQILFFAALAAIATVVWSILDRRRTNYVTLHRWLRVYVALYLGVQMFEYGLGKVFSSQILPPSQSRLLVRLGDMSPQALLWAFMGASKTYTVFTGLVEVMGGALLFVPRLTTLGALLSAGALTNILMLNVSYDFWVKLGSAMLLLMSLFLIGPDAGRLASVLVLNRRAEPANRESFFHRKWLNRAFLAVQLAFGGYVLVSSSMEVYQRGQKFAQRAQSVPFYGIWRVDEFTVNRQRRPPLLTDEVRWQQLVFDFHDGLYCCEPYLGMTIQSMEGYRRLYWMQVDRVKKVIQLMKLNDEEVRGAGFEPPPFQATAQFTFDNPTPEQLVLEGNLEGQHIYAILHRASTNFILLNRGFHWVNNVPFVGR
jgi:uncharacterized membrane protein YphA (DoxX/SURF4 family)